jgi:hypothetical protein
MVKYIELAKLPQIRAQNCQPIIDGKICHKEQQSASIICLRPRNVQYYEKPTFSKKQKYFEILKWTKINVQK